MPKKRTKKQKQNARHSFTLSWEPSGAEAKSNSGVKGQFKNKPNSSKSKLAANKSSIDSAQNDDISKTRRGIIKSLILAGIILGTEIMLYFFWN